MHPTLTLQESALVSWNSGYLFAQIPLCCKLGKGLVARAALEAQHKDLLVLLLVVVAELEVPLEDLALQCSGVAMQVKFVANCIKCSFIARSLFSSPMPASTNTGVIP